MMYEEFTKRLEDQLCDKPTILEYENIIEPVYNYHPLFDGSFAKDRCAKLYATCGLGVFMAMRAEADEAKELENECQNLRNKFGKAAEIVEQKKRELDVAERLLGEADDKLREAQEQSCAWRESVRKMWRCA